MFLTLGIETSCDETACAVLENGDRIRSNVISSSLFKHKAFGGVVPEIASRHCLEQIDFVFKTALRKARVSKEDLDLIAVTRGPGLVGSILVGLSFAKALAYRLGIPFVGVNHLEAHLSANFIGRPAPRHPYVGLIVSGGHTELTYHRNGSIKILGSTVDDAVGEAYDKVAKLLGLGYPGGPIVDRLAQQGNPKAFRFTRPKQEGRFDFSFSGIKTAVRNLVASRPEAQHSRRGAEGPSARGGPASGGREPSGRSGPLRMTEERFGRPQDDDARRQIASPAAKARGARNDIGVDLCASFQETVAHWLVEKTIDACRTRKAREVVVGGGVSANSRLRSLLAEEAKPYGIRVSFPPFFLTLDNGAMIARRGFELYRKGKRSDWRTSANPNLRVGES